MNNRLIAKYNNGSICGVVEKIMKNLMLFLTYRTTKVKTWMHKCMQDIQISITPSRIHQPLAQVYGEWVSGYSSFAWIVDFNDFFASTCSLGRKDDVSTLKEMVGCHER